MSCARFETEIALYAGGDLPAVEAARIESHLARCADCRELVEELRASQALLSDLRDEPVEDLMVARLHSAVLMEARKAGSRRRATFIPLLAVAAALVLAVVLLWPRHAVQHVPVARMNPPRPATVPAPVAVVPVHHHVIRRHHHRPQAAQPGPPVLVQFVTGDPNIVIYWLIDQKTQGD